VWTIQSSQYVGFEAKGALREYIFRRCRPGGESSNYFVIVTNEAFVAHRTRYKDAPAICSIRLRTKFATQVIHPSSITFSVTDAELADYKNAHRPNVKNAHSKSRDEEDFLMSPTKARPSTGFTRTIKMQME
jgi:hypothetical protein